MANNTPSKTRTSTPERIALVVSSVAPLFFPLISLVILPISIYKLIQAIRLRREELVQLFGSSECPAMAGVRNLKYQAKQNKIAVEDAERAQIRREIGMEPVSVPPPLPAAASAEDEVVCALESLDVLRNRGMLTEEEYLEKRREILSRI